MQFIETLDNEIPSAKIPAADQCELKIVRTEHNRDVLHVLYNS